MIRPAELVKSFIVRLGHVFHRKTTRLGKGCRHLPSATRYRTVRRRWKPPITISGQRMPGMADGSRNWRFITKSMRYMHFVQFNSTSSNNFNALTERCDGWDALWRNVFYALPHHKCLQKIISIKMLKEHNHVMSVSKWPGIYPTTTQDVSASQK